MKYNDIIRQIVNVDYAQEKHLLIDAASFGKIDKSAVILVDVSGSMVNLYGEYSCIDHAKALCVILKEIFEDVAIYAASGNQSKKTTLTEKVPDYFGFALASAISRGTNALFGDGCFPNQSINFISHYEIKPDIFIFISDAEHDTIDKTFSRKYNVHINLGNEQNNNLYSSFRDPESFLKWLKVSFSN